MLNSTLANGLILTGVSPKISGSFFSIVFKSQFALVSN